MHEERRGQWGALLAMACSFFDINLEIYMVKVSYQEKPSRPRCSSPRPRAHLHLRAGASVLPAPESAQAIRVAIDEALKRKKTGEKKVIDFNLSGHGHFDTPALATAQLQVQV